MASSAGILEQSTGARSREGIGLSYRPARLHRLGSKKFKNTVSEDAGHYKDDSVRKCTVAEGPLYSVKDRLTHGTVKCTGGMSQEIEKVRLYSKQKGLFSEQEFLYSEQEESERTRKAM
jgi:hypothetical protein